MSRLRQARRGEYAKAVEAVLVLKPGVRDLRPALQAVYPVTKLSPERAASIFMRFGVDRMMVNSSADWGPSDCLSVPRTLVELRRRGMKERDLATLAWDNPVAFYAQSGKLKDLAAKRNAK